MPTVVLACNYLGMGGTERGMTTQALALSRGRFTPRILGIHGGGAQEARIRGAGLRVDVGHGDLGRLTELLGDADIVVQLRQGNAAPLLPAACRAAGVPQVVDWNMFGQVDRSEDEARFACHLFVSRTGALRYRRWTGQPSPDFHARHRVHYLPVETARPRSPYDITAARRRFGLDPDRPVICRAGRPDDVKWRNLLIDMLPALLQMVPELQVLLVGATPAKIARLKRLGVLHRCVLVDQQPDEELIADSYRAADVFVTAAEIGESQGLALLEAMSHGVPVVTCSTPWADNAQLEWIHHGRTGLVANHPQPFAEAVATLLGDEELRVALGRSGASLARELGPERQARQLELLFEGLLTHGRAPEIWSPSPAQLEGFEAEYRRRLELEFRPLRFSERLDARRRRWSESAQRRLRSSSLGIAGRSSRRRRASAFTAW